jgi:phage baseplate assembly protein W
VTKKFKSELVLDKNNFHQMEMREDKVALAQVIQNLLFTEKGTYPNQPSLGIGIENYLFELADKGTLTTLKDEIKAQIEKFSPTEYLVENNVKKEIVNGNTVLLLTFVIRDLTKSTETEFGIAVAKSKKTQKLISKLIV